MRQLRQTPAKPTIDGLLDRQVDKLDALLAEVRGGFRNQAHFAELEERATAIAAGIRDAFRKGACR